MMKYLFLFLMLLSYSLSSHASSEYQVLQLQGQKLEILLDGHRSKRPRPLLVLAPAKKYTMRGKILKTLAQEAAKMGFFVVRFNWGFVTSNKKPSPKLEKESEELIKILHFFKNHPKVKKGKTILLAKSFGSKVAMKKAYQNVEALFLMTPNCDKVHPFHQSYAGLFHFPGHSFLNISVDDPYCDIQQIYNSMQNLNARTTIHTLFGNHNFEVSDQNFEAMIKSSLNWLERIKEMP